MNINRVVNPTNSVTREHRTAFVMLLDLSSSMMECVCYDSSMMTKSSALSVVSNKILHELYIHSFRDNEVCDYYDIAILGYSKDRVYSLLNDSAEDPFVSITELAEQYKGRSWVNIYSASPISSPDFLEQQRADSIVVTAEGLTPMYEALSTLYRALNMWCSKFENYDSPAPIVFHITDGHPSDSGLDSIVDISNRVKSLGTNCGDVLLLNVIFDTEITKSPLFFPTDDEIENYPNTTVRTMARASSLMPESFAPLINELRESRRAGGYRGFGCNVSVADIISMLNIGTLSVVAK